MGSVSIWPHGGLKLQSLERTGTWWTRPEAATEYPGPSLRKWSGGPRGFFQYFKQPMGKKKHLIISTDASENCQHSFMIKTQQARNRG